MELSITKLFRPDMVATFECLNKEQSNSGRTCETCLYCHGLQVVADKVFIECGYCPTEEDLEWAGEKK